MSIIEQAQASGVQGVANATAVAGITLSAANRIEGWVGMAVPLVAGILSIVWFSLEIWESKTVREWRHKRTVGKLVQDARGDEE